MCRQGIWGRDKTEPALNFTLRFAQECLDPRYIGQALPIATALHRDWARFSQFGV